MDPFLVFDLETQRSADEVGGWGNIQSMLYSVAVVWDSEKKGMPFLLTFYIFAHSSDHTRHVLCDELMVS